jgi:hypothetical protein
MVGISLTKGSGGALSTGFRFIVRSSLHVRYREIDPGT